MVGVYFFGKPKWEATESLAELNSLVSTAGAMIAGSTLAEVREITPKTFIGKGKVELLKNQITGSNANLVIFDGELAPSQNRNLEEAWGVRVIDRTSLILDIFAIHAQSKEGKLQVELAQYQYLLPRLVGAWSHFSKQRGGGVGLRGPGETQLEVDRRRASDKVVQIKKLLERVTSSRELHRQKRESVPIPTVTLVGYTNAGKSTLFNALTHGNQLVQDKLFATLDPKTTKIKLPSGREVLISDTVGFIRNLPHQLIEAFKSTFEEAGESDLLLHVIDGSHPEYDQQINVVEDVLKEIGLDSIPVIKVINKMDMPEFYFKGNGHKTIPISAQKGTCLEDLLLEIDQSLLENLSTLKLFLPHPYGKLLSNLYTYGHVLNSKSQSRGVRVEVALPDKWKMKYREYVTS